VESDFDNGVLYWAAGAIRSLNNVHRPPQASERKLTMLKVLVHLTHFARRDDRGVTAVEYALLLIAVAVVLLASLRIFGPALGGVFNTAAADL
jgi:Flp pilus assembly pilin Flp